MPNFKKNAMNQIMFPMVDRIDFATIESGITASDFNSAATKKIFGVNHGVSDAFASATISKAATLVRSGIFQQTLKAAECNYDYLIVSFRHPSCADQILIFQPMEIDPSDAYSMLSDFMSDFQSRVPKLVATNSQVSDLSSDLRSVMIVMSGIQSDIYSSLSDLQSDFQSRVPKRVATDSQLSDLHSDLRSFLVVMSGIQSDIYSNLSDLQSDFQSRVPKRVATDSQLSDVSSDLRSLIGVGHPINASDMSDLRSAIAAGPAATITASDISDIASAVKVILASDMSDILSAAQQTNSRVLVTQSHASNIYSLLSDVQSDFQSRVPKRVATDSQLSDVHSDLRSQIAGITATLSLSDISDIASAVKVILASDMSDILSAAQQTNSRVLVTQSHASNIYSLLSDVQSDFQSRVPKRVATDSQLSDVSSDLRSLIGVGHPINASDMSDLRSAIAAGAAANITQSDISNIASAVYGMVFGDGAVQVTLTAKDGANLLEGVDIWVTTDTAGLDIVARGYTNALGVLTVYLDPGVYFVWKQLSGFTFTNPESITVV